MLNSEFWYLELAMLMMFYLLLGLNTDWLLVLELAIQYNELLLGEKNMLSFNPMFIINCKKKKNKIYKNE